MVLDTGGVDDKSFNQSSWAGMTGGQRGQPEHQDLLRPVELAERLHAQPRRRARGKGCDTIDRRRWPDGPATSRPRAANPTQQFAEVDNASDGPRTSTASSSTPRRARFLGGYLAAGMTKTGKVATYGGLNIPPVTIYMDGFWEGVQYYNQQNSKSVKVLGWDEKQPEGRHVRERLHRPEQGQADQPGLHPAGRGHHLPGRRWHRPRLRVRRPRLQRGKVAVIWVDTDGCVSAPQYCPVFLTSVAKGLTDSVTKYVTDGGRRHVPDRLLHRHPGEQGHRPGPVPRLHSKVPDGLQRAAQRRSQADIAVGQDQHHVAEPAQVAELTQTRRRRVEPVEALTRRSFV